MSSLPPLLPLLLPPGTSAPPPPPPPPGTTSPPPPGTTSPPPHPDFHDLVQGEDMEFHRSVGKNFPVRHRIEALGDAAQLPLVHRWLAKMSALQLVTLLGAASGFLAGVVVCPLDVVKTRLQAEGARAEGARASARRSFVGEFSHIFRKEGVRGLYRGLVPITVGYLPTWTIYFSIYERAKMFYPGFMRRHFGLELDSVNHFCAALTAGLVSLIAVNPVWVVKTRLMIQTSTARPGAAAPYYTGTLDAFKRMYREEGMRVFYSGLVPLLFGLLHVGIHFPVYEKLKELTGCTRRVRVALAAAPAGESEEIDFHQGPPHLLWRLIFASSLAKMIASTITYPHEILRTRMQLRSGQYGAGPGGKLVRTLVSIFRREGERGFYAGYVVNLARTVPASAVTLVSFEYFKTYLLEVSGKNLA
jgi:solute carrier family 25 folate transporter 32